MLQYKKYYMPKSKEELFRLMEQNAHSFDIIPEAPICLQKKGLLLTVRTLQLISAALKIFP